jgi:phosphonopyruvate decarboxylase
MSLGSLVTVVAAGAANLSVVILDNGAYEVTGGQQTPATDIRVDYGQVARAARFPTVAQFCSASDWRRNASSVVSAPGPRFVWLRVEAARPDDLLTAPSSMREQIRRLRSELG